MLESDVLIDNIRRIAESRPERLFAKLLSQDRQATLVTYGDLMRRGGQFACLYQAVGVRQSEVVVIVHNELEQTIYAFVGALLCGAVPSIFAYPSVKISAREYSKTLALLLQVCNTRYLLTYKSLVDQVESNLDPNQIKLLLSEMLPENAPAGAATVGADDTALLQHSSGTTGLKKGVALSNRSVINQLRNYARAIDLRPDDKIVSWLPLYHDMGLIACFIMPLACGVPLVLMSPFEWIIHPAMLLRAITEEKATLCWMPNFAYNFLVAKVADHQLERLTLNTLRAFINCAEPISAASHQIFLERFGPFGLRSEMLNTCYAMAENTFAVTQSPIPSGGRIETIDAAALRLRQEAVPARIATGSAQTVVSSGRLIDNNELRIVDGAGSFLAERRVGEIIIKSDSMLTEYYHRPDLTSDAIKQGWYYTGDLGYVADGDLFVLGRKKDMIIVAGKNIYPQDIEEIVSGVEGVYPGRVAAFGVYNEAIGTEDVVVLAESAEEKAKHLAIKLAIARAIKEDLECVANEIIILPHMWLVKSSSGKISRAGNRERYFAELRTK